MIWDKKKVVFCVLFQSVLVKLVDSVLGSSAYWDNSRAMAYCV